MRIRIRMINRIVPADMCNLHSMRRAFPKSCAWNNARMTMAFRLVRCGRNCDQPCEKGEPLGQSGIDPTAWGMTEWRAHAIQASNRDSAAGIECPPRRADVLARL